MNKDEVKEGIAHLMWLLDNGILTREDEPHFETVLNYIKDLEKNSIPKQVIKDKIAEIKKYRKLAKEAIEEKVIIADSDSLNYGRAEAHNKDIQVLQEILKGENNENI